VAIRLYDEEFRQLYPDSFIEMAKEDGEEWVILRGKALASNGDGCKQQMLEAFDESWPAARAESWPAAERRPTTPPGLSTPFD